MDKAKHTRVLTKWNGNWKLCSKYTRLVKHESSLGFTRSWYDNTDLLEHTML